MLLALKTQLKGIYRFFNLGIKRVGHLPYFSLVSQRSDTLVVILK